MAHGYGTPSKVLLAAGKPETTLGATRAEMQKKKSDHLKQWCACVEKWIVITVLYKLLQANGSLHVQ